MHILFVTDHLGYQGKWHGLTTYFFNVLPELHRAGHRVSMCVLREDHPAAEQLRPAGVEVTFLNARPAAVGTLWRLRRLVLDGGVDVLDANQRESSGLSRLLGWLNASIPVVTRVIDSDPVPRLEQWVTRCLPQPDVTLCASAAMRETALHTYNIREDRVKVLHNAINVTALRPTSPDARERLRAAWRVAADAPVVVSTSRFTEEKRLDVLVGMIPEVIAAAPGTVFVFAGSGPDLDLCKSKAEQLGVVDATRFLGERSDIYDILAASDVAVMLCLREAFGYSAAEALGMGLPVVAYGSAGMLEVVGHERTGLLAPPGEDGVFCSNLTRVILDPALREALGEQAKKDIWRFHVDKHGAALVRLYTDLLNARRRPER